MVIDENILLKYGAIYQHYTAKEIIFSRGDNPMAYLQISKGTVDLNNYHEDGKEFTLNIFSVGQSIGESLLFGGNHYPMNAVAKDDCTLLCLPKAQFLQLLDENKNIVFRLLGHLSDRLFYKYAMLFGNSANEPIPKIVALLDYYKRSAFVEGQFKYAFPLTRQQIANLTGLRVETVIRTIKKMNEQGLILVKDRKIFY
ncbi:Crp/Fnr family transcriptional regulator [Chryseobacterium sp. RG1]|uniref:Crp/Fnr family transcriptional regulator n=1 Tax=Chryseobacterium tagetis TaxID=2801334 RepID=A0ABS8A4E0_9FLAO|nr:Crp/Fnr family transcriptional regulator [Chryseobacterium tagetis]MCA6067755.1 Crp/Fnr family transcriptional regulator [Chryseobacterium tagetis]